MKDSILKYILIVSLLMNFSLLGAAAYTHYRQVRYHRTAPFWDLTAHPARMHRSAPVCSSKRCR